MRRCGLAIAWGLWLTTLCAAGEWRSLLAEPAGAAARLPGGAAAADGRMSDGRFSLSSGERVALHIVDDTVIVIAVGPADLERGDGGKVLRVHRGNIAVASTSPGADLVFNVAIAGPQGADVFRAPPPSGTLYIEAGADGLRFAPTGSEAVTAVVPDAEEYPAGHVYHWDGQAWVPTDEPLAKLRVPGLDFTDVNSRLGVAAARDAQIDVQQRLVLNLLDVDITARARVVSANIAVPTELRVVTIGATNTFVVPVGNNQQTSGLTPGQQGGFANLTFPGLGSPASLSIGGAERVEALRRLAQGRAFATGGQGLGTGGLFRLGVIPIAPSPGILVGVRRP